MAGMQCSWGNMTIIDRLMALFWIPNISYLVLNRETRKRVVNTRGGAKMIGHTLAGRFKLCHQKQIQIRFKTQTLDFGKSEQYLLLICTAQGGFRSFETTLGQSLFWILWLITGVEFNENFQKNDHREKRNLPTKINFVFKQRICQWQRKLKVTQAPVIANNNKW